MKEYLCIVTAEGTLSNEPKSRKVRRTTKHQFQAKTDWRAQEIAKGIKSQFFQKTRTELRGEYNIWVRLYKMV